DVSARKTIMAIRKRISRLIDEGKGLHSNSSTMLEKIFEYLKQGKTVIVDLSLKDSYDANVLSAVLVRNLFENNKMYYTAQDDSKVIETVICVEEAQNVISEEFVRSNANPFVRLAKEGRKFKLGMIAITQRPSAIADEIRSQAENFFSFYMGNTDDIKSLVRSNINYDGVISRFIQNESIPGNLYMVSAKQSFALPVKVLEFEKLVADKTYK
ncbi:ATP-binding protein, partial [Treponema sp. R6D11]